jgi:hypothetical protein
MSEIGMSEPTPLLRVTVGAPVYARDGAKIGKVKEIRQGAFKVERGLLQPDYWLRGEAVESAVPDEAVTLIPDKDQVDDFKIEEPRAA